MGSILGTGRPAAAVERRLRTPPFKQYAFLPDSQLERVFEPFVRGEVSRSKATGGTGLGLAIARDIAKSHGGTVTLGESSMGGLRAIISVPL